MKLSDSDGQNLIDFDCFRRALFAVPPGGFRTFPMSSSILLFLFSLSLALNFAASSACAIEGREVNYSDGETQLSGYLALPDTHHGTYKLPAIIIVHEWWGHDDYVRRRANMIVEELGYIAFAVDMYGRGRRATHPKDAMQFASQVTKTSGLRELRFRAALDLLKARSDVDSERIAAIGYCFGGSTVLDMARLNLPLAAVASFHGSLKTKKWRIQ